MKIAAIFGLLIFALTSNAYSLRPIDDLDTTGRTLALEPCRLPVGVESMQVENKHYPDEKDEIRIVRCVGITSETYRTGSVTIPMRVELTARNKLIRRSLQIGSSRQRVVSVLGQPTVSNDNAATYSVSQERPDEDTVSFIFESGQVSSIIWVWAVD